MVPGLWVGGEIGSRLPSTKNTEPVSSAMSAQLAVHQICAGSSMGNAVLMVPVDLMSALSTPLAPCEWPMAPTALTLSLLKKGLALLALAAIRNLAPSRMVWP